MRLEGRAMRPQASETGGGRILAVVGATAGMVAHNLAGLLAQSFNHEGRRALLVDAEGYISQRILPMGIAPQPTEKLITGVAEPDGHLVHDADSGLRALLYPEQDRLPAAGIVQRLRGEFDALVVACGGSRYASDWLATADRVVVSGANSRALTEAVRWVEGLRGEEVALVVAPMGRLKLPGEVIERRRVFGLPSRKRGSFEEAESAGGFATLSDEEVRGAFEPLLQELLSAPRESNSSLHERPSQYRGNAETPSEESPESSLEQPPTKPSGPRNAESFSADGLLEKMRRSAQSQGAQDLDALEQKPDGYKQKDEESNSEQSDEPEEKRRFLGTKVTGLTAGISALAGRLRRRGGAEAAHRQGAPGTEVSAQELEQRLKISLRETAIGDTARVCVGSPKGGVGKSSIAYALAGSIAYYTNLRVCLVDADPNFGSTRLLVPRPVGHSVVTLAEAANDLRSLSGLREYVAQNEEMRLDVVLGPAQAHEMARFEDLGEAYGRIDSVLSRFYDLVIYDLGLGFRDPAIRRVLSLSNELLFVTDSEIIPNAMLADAIKYVENLGVELGRTTLVLNHRLPTVDESAVTPQVRTAHTSLLRRITEVPYDARMSQLLNRRSFHIEELTLRTRLGMLTTAAACLEGLRDANGPVDKVVA